jgi:hypothetical protein
MCYACKAVEGDILGPTERVSSDGHTPVASASSRAAPPRFPAGRWNYGCALHRREADQRTKHRGVRGTNLNVSLPLYMSDRANYGIFRSRITLTDTLSDYISSSSFYSFPCFIDKVLYSPRIKGRTRRTHAEDFSGPNRCPRAGWLGRSRIVAPMSSQQLPCRPAITRKRCVS